MGAKVELSSRVRPNVECAQWVIDEIKDQEAELTRLRAEVARLEAEKAEAVKDAERLLDAARGLRMHLALFCGPDDEIANEVFKIADAAIFDAKQAQCAKAETVLVLRDLPRDRLVALIERLSITPGACTVGYEDITQGDVENMRVIYSEVVRMAAIDTAMRGDREDG